MFRRHVTQFLLASSCALGLAPLAVAQPMGEGMMHEGMHGGMRHRGDAMMHMRELNLTEQQRDQIFKIHHDSVPPMREQMKQVQKARDDLRQVAMADKFDEAKARQAADTQAKAMANMAVMRAQTMNRVRQVLTPEQRQKMDQMRNRHGGMEPRGKG
jgi:Spy/CpxP family protein refolding chaperone